MTAFNIPVDKLLPENLTAQIGLADRAEIAADFKRLIAGNILPSYFFEPHGIHGISHTKRVLLMCLILSEALGVTQRDRELLITAALYHDIGRTHDYRCFEHGKTSFARIGAMNLVPDSFSAEDRNILRFVMENHCIQDKKAMASLPDYHTGDEERAVRLFNIFKDADGLDRVRIHDLNTDFLRLQVTKKMVGLAHHLLKTVN